MTQVLIDRATLEQLVRMLEQCLDDAIQVQCDLEQGYQKSRAAAQAKQVELSKESLAAGRAALANVEPVQQVPDMFWNHDDAETLYGSIDEFLNDEICNGTPLEVGDVRVIQRAVSMPKAQIRITAVHDEACEADYVEEPYVKATL